MATIEEKVTELTKLMNNGILTADEFTKIISILNNNNIEIIEKKEKTPLEKQYDVVFSKYIITVFKSPSSCKWPELTSDMVKKGNVTIENKSINCTYIETYIDATNSYGAMLRKKLRLIIDENGKIIRALQELQLPGVSLLGMLANAANKDNWTDIVKLPSNMEY